MSVPSVEVDSVSKAFSLRRGASVPALSSVSLVVDAGECVAIVGQNGCGKSTLLNIIAGLVRADEGRVLLDGRSPREPLARQRLGFVGEADGVPEFITGRDWLVFQGRLRGLSGAVLVKAVAQRGEELGIRRELGRAVATYSRGMRQRLALAGALLGSPRVLVFDEPESGVDPDGRAAINDVLAAMRAAGTAVLLSTHHAGDVSAIMDRMVRLEQGCVVERAERGGES